MVRGAIQIFKSILSMSKIILILLFTIFLPRMFMSHMNNKIYNPLHNKKADFKLGLENISNTLISTLKTQNIALITNKTGKDQHGNATLEVLSQKEIPIKKIFSDTTDVIKKLDHTNLKNIDTIIFDMQETGIEHNNYIMTLCQSIEAASQYNKKIIVLDRPNPLGAIIEGPLAEENMTPDIPHIPIPLRHGMTPGEIASYYNNYIATKPANLEIVTMKQYARNNTIPANQISSYVFPFATETNSQYGHNFLGLLETIKPFDIGAKVDNIFQVILIPDSIEFSKIKWQQLHKLLQSYGIQSNFYRYFNKKQKNYCSGLKLKIIDMTKLPTCTMLIQMLKFFKDNNLPMKPSALFDTIMGTNLIRQYIENKYSWNKLVKKINRDLFIFYNKAAHCFVYKPFPRPEYL